MVGGAGNDFYYVDNAGDPVIEKVGEGSDTVYSTAHLRLSANLENLVLKGGADLQGYGNAWRTRSMAIAATISSMAAPAPTSCYGGAGTIPTIVDDPADDVIENAGEGTDTVFSTAHLGWRRTWRPWCCREAPICRATAIVCQLDLRQQRQQSARRRYRRRHPDGSGRQRHLFRRQCRRWVTENAAEGTDMVLATVSFSSSANVEQLVLQGRAISTAPATMGPTTLRQYRQQLLDGGVGAICSSGTRQRHLRVQFGTASATQSSTSPAMAGRRETRSNSWGSARPEGATFTQIGATNQWLIHSGLGGPDEDHHAAERRYGRSERCVLLVMPLEPGRLQVC